MRLPDTAESHSRIIVDDRIGSAELLPHLPPEIAELGRLQYGDVAFQGWGPQRVPWWIGIERKTVYDFVDSFTTGRLQGNQIPGICNSYNKSYLILEGITKRKGNILQVLQYGKWKDLTISVNSFEHIVNTFECLAGITFKTSNSITDTVTVILSLYEWWSKGFHKHKSHLGFAVEPHPVTCFGRPALLRRIAKELPGVGWERASSIEKSFSSVLDMVNADEQRWREIPNIGPKLAHRIVEEINGL